MGAPANPSQLQRPRKAKVNKKVSWADLQSSIERVTPSNQHLEDVAGPSLEKQSTSSCLQDDPGKANQEGDLPEAQPRSHDEKAAIWKKLSEISPPFVKINRHGNDVVASRQTASKVDRRKASTHKVKLASLRSSFHAISPLITTCRPQPGTGLLHTRNMAQNDLLLSKQPCEFRVCSENTDQCFQKQEVSKRKLNFKSRFTVLPVLSLYGGGKRPLCTKKMMRGICPHGSKGGWSKRYTSILGIENDQIAGKEYHNAEPFDGADLSKPEMNMSAVFLEKLQAANEEMARILENDAAVSKTNEWVDLQEKLTAANEEIVKAEIDFQERVCDKRTRVKTRNGPKARRDGAGKMNGGDSACAWEEGSICKEAGASLVQTVSGSQESNTSSGEASDESVSQPGQIKYVEQRSNASTTSHAIAQRKTSKKRCSNDRPPSLKIRAPSMSDLWIASERCPQVCTTGPVRPDARGACKAMETGAGAGAATTTIDEEEKQREDAICRGARCALSLYESLLRGV